MDFPRAVLALLDDEIVSEEQLPGGLISLTRRITTESGSYVVKQCATAPPNLYQREAEGLRELTKSDGPRVPEVLNVAEDHLLLEDLGKHEPPAGFWETFGRQVARLHSHTKPQFGFHHDNYLGILLMDNTWSDDGHEFFARTRILRFLSEPLSEEWLTAEDRQGVESIARRLPELVPSQPASLIHGDLWVSNMLVAPDGSPAMIDPAAHYGWAEAELSMTCAYDGVDPVFFDAYREVRPIEPGWEERFEILNVRELLSMVAHQGNTYGTVNALRALLAKFA